MKISHNAKNERARNPIDGFVKSNIDLLDLKSPPTLFWNKSDSWNIIKSKIKSTNRKSIIWAMALAATVSMTIGAGIQFHLIPNIENSTIKALASVPTHHYKTNDKNINKKINDKQILSTIIPVVDNTIKTADIALPEIIVTQSSRIISDEFEYNSYSINKIINPYFTLGTSSSTLKPEIGIDISLLRYNKNIKSQNLKLGLSTEFISQKTEQKVKVTPYHFANLTFESRNKLNNKGWAIRTGILLNPDSNYYKGTTMKLVLSRKFNEWIKIGPELIFTNSMKNIYPALSISLG